MDGAATSAPSRWTQLGARPTERDGLLGVIERYRIPLLVVAASVVAVVVAIQARPITLLDDAAITFRYAHRIAAGDGWTYNDGDQTNGASAPLYTMILAAMKAVGFELITAARIIGTVCYAASIGLATYLGTRIAGWWAGLLTAFFALTWIDFQTQALNGMESALAVTLGLAVIACLSWERDTWAGVLLGLALLNKLDAGMLALAVAVAVVVVQRRPPWRIAAISAAMVAPWLLFSWLYFGSPLPNSLTQKVSEDSTATNIDVPFGWVIDSLRAQRVGPFVLLAAASVVAIPFLTRRRPRGAVVLAACVAWPLFHGLAFTLLDLGDAYSWYLTALYLPLAIASAAAVTMAARSARGEARPLAVAVAVAVSLGVTGAADSDFGAVGVVSETIRNGHEPTEFEAFEKARRDAAKELAALAEPDDVIATCFGWYAFEAIDNPIYELCQLNTRDPVGQPTWQGAATFGSKEIQERHPVGSEIVLTIYSDVGLGGRADILRLDVADDEN